MRTHLVLLVVIVGHLISRAQLRGDTAGEAADMAVVNTRAARVCHVPEWRRVGVVEAVGNRLVHAEIAERAVEPDLLLDDRSANARVEVVVLGEPTHVGEEVTRLVEGGIARQIGARAWLTHAGGAAVVGPPRRGRIVAQHDAVERVAAVLGHHVHTDAALAHFGRVGAGHVAVFLETLIVPVDAAVGTLRAEVVETQPLDGLHRISRPAILQRGLLEVARAADVARDRAAAADRDRGAGNQNAGRLDVAARRDGVHHFAGHDRATRDALRVDDWRFG